MNDHAETKRAGRGFLTIGAAKLYFVLAAFIVQFGLPRLFQDAADFGLYAHAMAGVAILTNILIASTIQSVSKVVSEAREQAEVAGRRAIQLMAGIGLTLALLAFGLSGALAELSRDPALKPLIEAASLVIFAYAIYAALVGRLNGEERFGDQAKLDAGFTTLRTLGILGGAALGFGAIGAVFGFAIAAILILFLALMKVGWGKRAAPDEGVSYQRFLVFMAPIFLYQGLMNAMLQIDLWVIKPVLIDLLSASNGPELAAREANEIVGHYRGAQNFAFVPYQLVLATTFIVLPMVSRALATGNEARARETTLVAVRFALIASAFFAAPIAGAASPLLALAYPADYGVGDEALRFLLLGIVPFTVFVVAATILNAANRPRISALLAFIGVSSIIVLNLTLVGASGGLELPALRSAAIATGSGMGLAFILSLGALRLRFGPLRILPRLLRVGVASALAFLASAQLAALMTPRSPFFGAPLALAGGALVFLIALFLTAELGKSELNALRNMLTRRSR